ncbi:hypothetical protein KW799_02870, partial [Candidatus Parcubacteria bacterium]|nr:hypothetical protein [Candidatus Parcubacteria bacterium]
MKNLRKLTCSAAIFSVAALAAAVPAQAQVGAGLNVGVDAGVNASGTGTGTSSPNSRGSVMKANSAAYNASATGTANANQRSAVAATATSSTTTRGNNGNNNNGNNVGNPAYNTLNGSMNAGASSSVNTFVLTRQDIAATTTDYIAPASVTSPNDFEAYARSLMMSDENIIKIASNDNQVSVWYREPARFLGVIPMTVTVQAMVDAGGNVTVNYPWWYG